MAWPRNPGVGDYTAGSNPEPSAPGANTGTSNPTAVGSWPADATVPNDQSVDDNNEFAVPGNMDEMSEPEPQGVSSQSRDASTSGWPNTPMEGLQSDGRFSTPGNIAPSSDPCC
jgi:hypothetical protein